MLTAALQSRGLKPASVLAANREHGDRLRYMGGCRCADCRRANSRYEGDRARARKAGDWNGIVPAQKARTHLLKLARLGVGRRAVGASTDIGDTILHAIRQGTRKRIRARTERLILAVGVAQGGEARLVDAKRTWKLIDELIEEGYSIKRLATEMGFKNPSLQFGRERVTARTAAKVERLHRRLTT